MRKIDPVDITLRPEEAIVAYKRLLQEVLNQRPSGTRQRLADALGKNRSFITQMTSPTYPTPIPHRHLGTVLSACHFTPEERDAFMLAYRQAISAHKIVASPQGDVLFLSKENFSNEPPKVIVFFPA